MTDVLATLVTLLDSNWNSGNVVKPSIAKIVDQKRVDLTKTAVASGSELNVLMVNETTIPAGIGRTAKRKTYTVRVDIRTGVSHSHGILIKEEVERITDSKLLEMSGINIIGDPTIQDLSNRSTGIYRWTLDYELHDYVIARGT